MLKAQNLKILAIVFSSSKGSSSWGVRKIMQIFLLLLFGTIILTFLVPTVLGSASIVDCSSPYMRAVASLIGDATGRNIC